MLDNQILNLEKDIININAIKDMVLAKLCELKLLTGDEATKFATDYQIIIVKPNWFKTWCNNTFKNNPDNYVYKIIKFE